MPVGLQLELGAARRRPGELADVVAVEELEAHGRPDALRPGLQACVPSGHNRDPELGPHLVIGRRNALGIGHLDLAAAITVEGFDLSHRAAGGPGGGVGLLEQFDFAALAHPGGLDLDRRWARDEPAGKGHLAGASTTTASSPGRRFGRPQEPRLGQVRGMGEAGGVAGHDADARPSLPARTDVFDAAVVQGHRRPPAVLGEHLGELASGVEGAAQDAGQDGLVDQERCLHCRGHGRDQVSGRLAAERVRRAGLGPTRCPWTALRSTFARADVGG